MKHIVILFGYMILSGFLSAQTLDSKFYVVSFYDKGFSTDASFDPGQFLTNEAVERRMKYNIAFDQSDLPVNEGYVNDISVLGAKIITRSRWLNSVVIEATQPVADQIADLACVSKMKFLYSKSDLNSQPAEKKFFAVEKIFPLSENSTVKSTSDVYNYGLAFNQINQIKGQYLHNQGFSGEGMTIAVIDAGFNSVDIMPCFDQLRQNNRIKGTHDFAEPGNNVYATTMNGHGTSVLSCMGAYVPGQMVGTAPKANYWLLRSEVAPTESIIEEYYWVSAAEFADSVGVDLINSSLGYTVFPDSPESNHTYADMNGNTAVVTIGADWAAKKGILVVNSAGNEGGGGWWYIGAPADGDSVFTIGAVDASGIRAFFSSVGPTFDGRIKPTVMAQGVNATVFSPYGLGGANGTSFSSPIICGATACFWQALPQLNNMQIIEAIKITSSNALQADSLMGWGIPNYQLAYTTLPVHSEPGTKMLEVYPNPVSDHLYVTTPININRDVKIELYNIQGQRVYMNQQVIPVNTNTIQINELDFLLPGMYLLKLSDDKMNYSARVLKN